MPALFVALLGICTAVGSVIYGMIRWIKDAGRKRRITGMADETRQSSGHLRVSTGRILFGRTHSAPVTQEK